MGLSNLARHIRDLKREKIQRNGPLGSPTINNNTKTVAERTMEAIRAKKQLIHGQIGRVSNGPVIVADSIDPDGKMTRRNTEERRKRKIRELKQALADTGRANVLLNPVPMADPTPNWAKGTTSSKPAKTINKKDLTKLMDMLKKQPIVSPKNLFQGQIDEMSKELAVDLKLLKNKSDASSYAMRQQTGLMGKEYFKNIIGGML